MPSFDLISKLDIGELKNALIMAQKKIGGRYDFKGSKISLELTKKDSELFIKGEDEYKVKTALEIFYESMAKRGLGLKGLDVGDIEPSGNQMYKLAITIKTGIDKEQGKIINKAIKTSGLKVTSQYLDEKVRVTSKKIDVLQETFKMLKAHKDVNIDLAMENMK